MSYRYQSQFRELLDPYRRRLKSLLSRRRQGTVDADLKPEMLGRVAGDGDQERDTGDSFQPVGLVARAGTAAVESICAFIGAESDHPVEIATYDHGRRAVIDACGLQADETILYTSNGAIKIDKDGVSYAGPVDRFENFEALVTRSEFNALVAQVRSNNATLKNHMHPTAAVGPPSKPVSPPPPDVPPDTPPSTMVLIDPDDAIGTQYLKAK